MLIINIIHNHQYKLGYDTNTIIVTKMKTWISIKELWYRELFLLFYTQDRYSSTQKYLEKHKNVLKIYQNLHSHLWDFKNLTTRMTDTILNIFTVIASQTQILSIHFIISTNFVFSDKIGFSWTPNILRQIFLCPLTYKQTKEH